MENLLAKEGSPADLGPRLIAGVTGHGQDALLPLVPDLVQHANQPGRQAYRERRAAAQTRPQGDLTHNLEHKSVSQDYRLDNYLVVDCRRQS